MLETTIQTDINFKLYESGKFRWLNWQQWVTISLVVLLLVICSCRCPGYKWAWILLRDLHPTFWSTFTRTGMRILILQHYEFLLLYLCRLYKKSVIKFKNRKHYIRNLTDQQGLINLATISIEHYIASKIPFEETVGSFPAKKSQRVKFLLLEHLTVCIS